MPVCGLLVSRLASLEGPTMRDRPKSQIRALRWLSMRMLFCGAEENQRSTPINADWTAPDSDPHEQWMVHIDEDIVSLQQHPRTRAVSLCKVSGCHLLSSFFHSQLVCDYASMSLPIRSCKATRDVNPCHTQKGSINIPEGQALRGQSRSCLLRRRRAEQDCDDSIEP